MEQSRKIAALRYATQRAAGLPATDIRDKPNWDEYLFDRKGATNFGALLYAILGQGTLFLTAQTNRRALYKIFGRDVSPKQILDFEFNSDTWKNNGGLYI